MLTKPKLKQKGDDVAVDLTARGLQVYIYSFIHPSNHLSRYISISGCSCVHTYIHPSIYIYLYLYLYLYLCRYPTMWLSI